jgi:hypothetical protein
MRKASLRAIDSLLLAIKTQEPPITYKIKKNRNGLTVSSTMEKTRNKRVQVNKEKNSITFSVGVDLVIHFLPESFGLRS